MQYHKPHTALLYSYGFIVTIITIALVTWATNITLAAYRLHWVILIIALLLCCTPFGRQQLVANSTETPRYPLGAWLTRLFALQLALWLVFIGINLVFTYWLPLGNAANPETIRLSLVTALQYDGLLPWAIIAIYASRLGYLCYVQNQDAYFSRLLNSEPGSVLGIILNTQARSASFIALAATFALMTLLIAVLITPSSIPLQTGFHGKTLIIICTLAILSVTTPFKKGIKKILHPKIPLSLGIASALVMLALLIGLLNAFFGHLGQAPLPAPALLSWLNNKNSQLLWLLFTMTWWLGWAPLLALYIARLSRGYHSRDIIVANLLLPAVLCLLLISWPPIIAFISHWPNLLSILALIAFFYLLTILLNKPLLPLLVKNYLPKRDQPKYRDPIFYCRKLLQISIIFIYLYLPTGISIPLIITLMMTLSFTIRVPIDLLLTFWRHIRKR